MDNNLDNKWTLRDLPRIAWENIKEGWRSLWDGSKTWPELALSLILAWLVWLILAGLFVAGK